MLLLGGLRGRKGRRGSRGVYVGRWMERGWIAPFRACIRNLLYLWLSIYTCDDSFMCMLEIGTPK